MTWLPEHPRPLLTARPATWLATVGILLQVAYPLLPADALPPVTVASVLALAGAATTHAVTTRGRSWGWTFVGTVVGLSYFAEVVGVHTGAPFGDYSYAASLGPSLLGVPVLVPLAWLSLGYPAYLCGHALGGLRLGWIAAAWTLTTWDLFLDPQMVAAGHWSWHGEPASLPGVPDIPAVNYLGWLLVSAVLMLTLRQLLPPTRLAPGRLPHDAMPIVVLIWTYCSQVLANLVFWNRPSVALVGGIAMGLTVVPFSMRLIGELRGQRVRT